MADVDGGSVYSSSDRYLSIRPVEVERSRKEKQTKHINVASFPPTWLTVEIIDTLFGRQVFIYEDGTTPTNNRKQGRSQAKT